MCNTQTRNYTTMSTMVTLSNYHIVNDHEEGGGCISVYVSQMLHKTYILLWGFKMIKF